MDRACDIQVIDKRQISKILIRHVSAGPSHALVCSTNYQVFSWGDNNYGQLGLNQPVLKGTIVNKATVVEELGNQEIVMTAAGKNHSLFLTKEGRMYSCGYN